MADGSPERRADDQIDNLTFSATDTSCRDTKKCSGHGYEGGRLKLAFYTELGASDSCENSETRGVVADCTVATATTDSRKTPGSSIDDGDERKKRCFDRYDSSESSDSGVAVLSPTESGGCSSSDITEPRSPRSPESACSTSEEGAGARMPPWASDPAPPGPRRLAAQPAPLRRPNPPIHRRITEYFNHKMKPQNAVKRDSNSNNDDTKVMSKKCLPKNGVTHDLEKYISYLSQTLSPKLLDVGKQAEAANKISQTSVTADCSKTDLPKTATNSNINGIKEGRCKDVKDIHKVNGFMDARHGMDAFNKEKNQGVFFNGLTDSKKQNIKIPQGPSANMVNGNKSKVAIPATSDLVGLRIAPATSMSQSPKKQNTKHDTTKVNGIVSSTTKMDSRMNGVTCGSNNLNLINKPAKKEPVRKNAQTKRTNRKSSACIANSKNLTWSKANNLKQVQMQKQNCTNSLHNSPVKSVSGEASSAPKMNIPNGVRQVSMTVNGNLGNLNVPVANLQNCHQINLPQQCNGTVTSNNLASFVAVPQNVMLTTLRIPQNGLPAQTNLNLNQQGNIAAFNRPNVNVSSPTKLNGQFVFPLMQNINGTVVQIPNLMTKMPNFVLPQNPQLGAPRQDHLQNQQAAQILINGTLLKLANTIPPTFTNTNKTGPVTSQSIPVINKNVPGLQGMGMTVQPKPNFTVNLSHSVLVPQPGFIVTSVPNINVKETWSYSNTSSVPSSQSSCSNPVVHHPPPIVANFTTQTLHTSSIPIAPVKPPDNPIQGTEPPSSTVKEHEISELTNQKCDIPWLSKTVNNNIAPLDSNKLSSRPFAQVSSCSGSIDVKKIAKENKLCGDMKDESIVQSTTNDIRKVEEVARREETLFTQITVLKDVSSNVQSSVIEANFCNTTTESSESGIGTDKSIDSPSDSQTSKECDEDSSLSLSISVSSGETQSCQKSPILKQPKILRFPPKSLTKPENNQRTSSTETTSVTVCLWENCKREFESDSDLLEHLQSTHVESQAGKENYVCLWEQCKVRGKPSCSRLWLERHALSHGGNKPFKCIVDGCDRRFSTQTLLERHVNNHFNESSPGNANKKTADSSTKLIRRNGKKLRYRRQPWSARMFDFFDAGMMEGLAYRLSRCTRWRLAGGCPLREPAGRHTLTLHAALAATRYNASEARREALLTYYPPHVIEDEWVPESEVKRIKRVEIATLPAHTKVLLYEQFCSSYRKPDSPPPSRRSPTPSPAATTTPAPTPVRLLPPRQCTSSRLLNKLIAKQRKERNDCSATNVPMEYQDTSERKEVSGAKKRKMGRRYGGDSFMPCGR